MTIFEEIDKHFNGGVKIDRITMDATEQCYKVSVYISPYVRVTVCVNSYNKLIPAIEKEIDNYINQHLNLD